MSPAESRQMTITLSRAAYEDFDRAAAHKGMPLAALVRNYLETIHESPSFGAFLRRIDEQERRVAEFEK